MDRDLPEGVIDANPPGGWEGVVDGESTEQNAEAEGSPDLIDDDGQRTAEGVATPDDPVSGEQARQVADPDMSPERGEQP